MHFVSENGREPVGRGGGKSWPKSDMLDVKLVRIRHVVVNIDCQLDRI